MTTPAVDAPPGSYRERPIEPGRTALLSIDMQNAEYSPALIAEARRPGFSSAAMLPFYEQIESVLIPNQQRLQAAARAAGIEVIFTTIESFTRDGRDRSLDNKLSQLQFPKGPEQAKVIDAVGPRGDEIHILRTASGISNATNNDFVLRNLGVQFLVIYGVCTDQCVETAIRDAGDRGCLVTQVDDACAAEEASRHDRSIEAMRGHYCRTRTTAEMVAEIEATAPARS